MKKNVLAIFLGLAIGSSAFAADTSQMSVGAGYGFGNGGVLSVHGDYDISKMANNQPVKIRVGYDNYSIDNGFASSTYKWSYNVFYAGAYYDFGKNLQLDKKIHPFVGLGFGFGSASCSGSFCNGISTPTVGGLYYIGGVQYDVMPNVAIEANFNGWGGISLGANYKF